MSNLLNLINQRKAAVSRVKTLKPNPGRNRYRILPSWRGADQQFWMDFGQHWIKDATGKIQAVYVCNDKTFGSHCQVCDAISQGILMSGDDLTKKRLEEARSTARVLLNVLDLGSPNPMQVHILEIAPTIFNGNKGVGGIISLFQDWPNLLDLDGGAEVIIEKSGTGKETRYGVSAIPGKAVDKSVLANLHNLDQFVAAEGEAGASRALSSLAAISGVLPAPSAPATASAARSATSPAVAATSFSLDDDADADALRSLESDPPFEAAKPAAAAPAAAKPTAKSGDDELEDLLADLG